VFTGASRFDGRVQRKQIGLFGEVIDDFDDLSDVIGAVTENVDDFGGRLDGLIGAVEAIGGLFHGLNAGDDFLARAVGDIEQDLGGIGDALNGSNHLIDRSGGFRDAGGLNLSVLDDVLHVDAHLVHGAGDFFNRGGGLDADLCGFVCGAGNLIRTRGNLTRGIARGADKILQAVGHAQECIAESVPLGTRHDFDGQIAFGHGHGDAGHFLQISDHIVEGGGQGANFVVAVNINVLVEVAGVADFARNGDEVRQRFGDGFRGQEGDDSAGEER